MSELNSRVPTGVWSVIDAILVNANEAQTASDGRDNDEPFSKPRCSRRREEAETWRAHGGKPPHDGAYKTTGVFAWNASENVLDRGLLASSTSSLMKGDRRRGEMVFGQRKSRL